MSRTGHGSGMPHAVKPNTAVSTSERITIGRARDLAAEWAEKYPPKLTQQERKLEKLLAARAGPQRRRYSSRSVLSIPDTPEHEGVTALSPSEQGQRNDGMLTDKSPQRRASRLRAESTSDIVLNTTDDVPDCEKDGMPSSPTGDAKPRETTMSTTSRTLFHVPSGLSVFPGEDPTCFMGAIDDRVKDQASEFRKRLESVRVRPSSSRNLPLTHLPAAARKVRSNSKSDLHTTFPLMRTQSEGGELLGNNASFRLRFRDDEVRDDVTKTDEPPARPPARTEGENWMMKRIQDLEFEVQSWRTMFRQEAGRRAELIDAYARIEQLEKQLAETQAAVLAAENRAYNATQRQRSLTTELNHLRTVHDDSLFHRLSTETDALTSPQ